MFLFIENKIHARVLGNLPDGISQTGHWEFTIRYDITIEGYIQSSLDFFIRHWRNN
jgi:hypothetical protein